MNNWKDISICINGQVNVKYLAILNDLCRNYNSGLNKKSVNIFSVKDNKSSYHLIIGALASNLPFWLHSEPAGSYISNIK